MTSEERPSLGGGIAQPRSYGAVGRRRGGRWPVSACSNGAIRAHALSDSSPRPTTHLLSAHDHEQDPQDTL